MSQSRQQVTDDLHDASAAATARGAMFAADGAGGATAVEVANELAALRAEVERLEHVVAAAEDAREDARTQLAHEALHDHLTGLPNRALLLDCIQRALASHAQVAVLFGNLDRFKLLNDSRDHATGDTVLMTLASRLQRACRPEDTVGRFGGDELVVVRPLGAHETHAEVLAFAHELAEVVGRPIRAPGGVVTVSLSLGVAVGCATSTVAEDLLRDADTAMYRAKERGRARIECFDGAIRAELRARVDFEARLRRALAERAITVAYQPIVALGDGTIVGFEALARWVDEELGVVAPDRFIPVAEEIRVVGRLGADVLAQVCRDVGPLVDAASSSLTVTINLSAEELVEPLLPSLVAHTTAANGVHPWQLTFEVTEGGLLHDLDGAVANLNRLQALGCKVSLDDFGTGYSSLSRIKHLPLDVVKIDRCFVHGLAAETRDGAADAAIVGSVVRVADVLGHEVVAEGIEEGAQLRAARDLGVAQGQGFLFAPPMPLDEALRFLAHWDPSHLSDLARR